MSVPYIRLLSALGVSASLGALAAPAIAHHSFAMFDNQKALSLDGTVKDFQWTNPHTWVQLVVRDASGKDSEWSIEGGSPNALARSGWKRTALKPGDRAVLIIHPLKDGTNGGSLVSASVNGVLIGARP
jgi:hypothetical protein